MFTAINTKSKKSYSIIAVSPDTITVKLPSQPKEYTWETFWKKYTLTDGTSEYTQETVTGETLAALFTEINSTSEQPEEPKADIPEEPKADTPADDEKADAKAKPSADEKKAERAAERLAKASNAHAVQDNFLSYLKTTQCVYAANLEHEKLNRVVTVYAPNSKALLLYASFANKGVRVQVRYLEQLHNIGIADDNIKTLAAARSGNFGAVIDYSDTVMASLFTIINDGQEMYLAEKAEKDAAREAAKAAKKEAAAKTEQEAPAAK